MPKIDVYFYVIPNTIKFSKLFPKDRQDELDKSTSEKVKKQKYCVWKVLECALKNSFDIDLKSAKLKKEPSGKWGSEFCNFSMSHSDKYVAVAVSDFPIGIDIESLSKIKACEKLFDKIACESERNIECNVANIAFLWTKKESIFKKDGAGGFIPKNIDTKKNKTKSFFLDEDEVVSIACEKMGIVNLYKVAEEKYIIEKIKITE